MQTAVQVIWWIGIAGALVLTLIILKEVALVLRTLKGIQELARYIRDAALGIAANTQVGAGLQRLGGPAQKLREGAGSLLSTLTTLEQQTADLAKRGG